MRAWDLAATAASAGGNPDWTVGLKLGLAADGTHVVLDVVRVRAGPAAVEALLRATAEADGPGTAIALPQDPGQAGVAQVAHLRRVLEGFTVIASPESGSKQTRALPAAARIGAGRTRVLRAAWTDAFVAELRTFPNGEKDDQVDALARAEAMLGQAPAAARMTKISMMGR
uniref:phage terminase large subunit n=1 Tax=Acidocella sp. C78 TaxID=1671486 RepID=UPI0020BFB62A|nr:phage terminase large subunit [Acidocella sp. C78]